MIFRALLIRFVDIPWYLAMLFFWLTIFISIILIFLITLNMTLVTRRNMSWHCWGSHLNSSRLRLVFNLFPIFFPVDFLLLFWDYFPFKFFTQHIHLVTLIYMSNYFFIFTNCDWHILPEFLIFLIDNIFIWII